MFLFYLIVNYLYNKNIQFAPDGYTGDEKSTILAYYARPKPHHKP